MPCRGYPLDPTSGAFVKGTKRTKIIKIRLNDEEYMALTHSKNTQPLAAFLRSQLMRSVASEIKIKKLDNPPIDNRIIRNFAYIGNNLNQIARAINTNIKTAQPLDILVISAQLLLLWEEIHDLQNI